MADRREFGLCLFLPDTHAHLAVHRRCAPEVRRSIARAVDGAREPAELEVTMGDEGPHAKRRGECAGVAEVCATRPVFR